ncbi:hypothetical protein F5X68DRAFT_235723 [Plectosphaerella plurivora]|uniref:Uncharacterized protein n=1 Tax=Plectosphaerella plurivora TaxID=936078 RepID=A0A9P8V1R7_9PEZI|nr:hypothetical protein F5X68DRAFT_235723 [Plectosphaerella plurivora]
MGVPKSPMYCEGTILRLQSHRPPEPFGHDYYKHEETPGIAQIDYHDLAGFCSQDYVFARHPRERYEPSIFELPSWYEDWQALTLEVQCVLSSSFARGAQTVLCRVHGEAPKVWKSMGHQSMPEYVAARIFDPLHYDGQDIVYVADYDYAQEASSYYQIHARRDHLVFKDKPEFVPKFYVTKDTGAVITDFSQACLAPYTDSGWLVHELLSKPNHPSHGIRIEDYEQFSGWFPPEWLSNNGKGDFTAWATETFSTENYTSLEEFNQLRKDSGWTKLLDDKFWY